MVHTVLRFLKKESCWPPQLFYGTLIRLSRILGSQPTCAFGNYISEDSVSAKAQCPPGLRTKPASQ